MWRISHEVNFAIFSHWMSDVVGQTVTTGTDTDKLPHVLIRWTHIADACPHKEANIFYSLNDLLQNLQSATLIDVTILII